MNCITIKQQRGINLLELILAITLCGMALLAVVGVQWKYHKAFQQDEMRLQARAIAASLMDRYEAKLRTNFDGGNQQPQIAVPAELDPEGVYQYECRESVVDPEVSLKRIEIEVRGDDKQGSQSEKLWCIFLRGE